MVFSLFSKDFKEFHAKYSWFNYTEKIEKSQMQVHKDTGLIVVHMIENQLNITLKSHKYKFQIQNWRQNSNT